MGRVFERVNRSVRGRGGTVDERGRVSMRHESSVELSFGRINFGGIQNAPFMIGDGVGVANVMWIHPLCRRDGVKGLTKLIGAAGAAVLIKFHSSTVLLYLQATICSWNDWQFTNQI